MKTDLNRFLQSVDQVEEKEVEWLVPHWIPKGGITLLVGDGGVGKTSIWCYLLARISANYSTMLDDDAYIRSGCRCHAGSQKQPSLRERAEPHLPLLFQGGLHCQAPEKNIGSL